MNHRIYEERLSDSPYVEKIGQFRTESSYSQVCAAGFLWNMLIVKLNGKTSLSVWVPETKSALMNFPEGAEFLFIQFKLGSFMPHLPNKNLVDGGIILPEATGQSFWLDSAAWQFPNYENADTFVEWLVHDGLLVYEPIVDAVLQDQPHDISLRSAQRRFLQATGLTHRYIRQIERAHHAMTLLQQGVSILDTVYEAGYFDQPHLTRALKHFIGLTPREIARISQPE